MCMSSPHGMDMLEALGLQSVNLVGSSLFIVLGLLCSSSLTKMESSCLRGAVLLMVLPFSFYNLPLSTYEGKVQTNVR